MAAGKGAGGQKEELVRYVIAPQHLLCLPECRRYPHFYLSCGLYDGQLKPRRFFRLSKDSFAVDYIQPKVKRSRLLIFFEMQMILKYLREDGSYKLQVDSYSTVHLDRSHIPLIEKAMKEYSEL